VRARENAARGAEFDGASRARVGASVTRARRAGEW